MINLSVAEPDNMLRPRLTVVGVGGAGGNAINNMIRSNLEGCEFVVANTDAQALAMSLAPRKLQLGTTFSRGLGAGSRPEVGCSAAEETLPEILSMLDGSDMLFVTAGMGGGTGTGAAPVIARAARESGILTVGVVTKPFHFEGSNRMRQAEGGIAELQQYVDTLIVIPNQNLFRIANERTTFAEAFRMADEVLNSGVRGITDLMVMPGFMNLDFADVKTVMAEMGKAMMGTGEAEGDNRALSAAEAAISNPLLDDISMKGARGVLINITGGLDMTLFEVDQAANRIREEVDPEAQIKVGSTLGENMDGRIRVSVIATGIDAAEEEKARKTIYSAAETGERTQRTTRSVQDARPSTVPVAMKTSPVTAAAHVAPAQPPAPPKQPAVKESTAAYFTMPTAIAPTSVSQKVPTSSVTMRAPQPKPVAKPEPVEVTSQREEPVAEEPVCEVEEIEPVVTQTTTQRPTVMAAPPVRELPPVQQAQRQKTAPVGTRVETSESAESMRMTQLTTSGSHPRTEAPSGNRRSMGLFQRITGIGIARPSRDELDEEFDRDVEEAVEASLRVDPSDRAVVSAGGEPDLLDIPAFLRRQSNH